LLVRGGQTLAHAPEQLDFPLLSATHRYSARPAASVRYVPADPLAVLIEVPVAAAFDAVEAPDAVELAEAAAAEVVAELEPVLLLPHPAAINATPRTAAAVTAGIFAFVRTVIRVLQFQRISMTRPLGWVINEDPSASSFLPTDWKDRPPAPPTAVPLRG
jgi:hypothetical protein